MRAAPCVANKGCWQALRMLKPYAGEGVSLCGIQVPTMPVGSSEADQAGSLQQG